jgi:dTDP-4-dehydrorhamnose 3,5-epimerase
MDIVKTGINGLIEIKPKIYQDQRGWFQELYKDSVFKNICGDTQFVQDNLSFSKKGVLRGLHLQTGLSGQAKLVTVISGKVLDVVVDLRKGSKTFGHSFQLELDGISRNMLYVPEGFAHGFSAIEDSLFLYKCSNEYDPTNETGIIWNDGDLNINWKNDNPVVSEKDIVLPTFKDLLRKSVISPL